jgi:hypothetical protein
MTEQDALAAYLTPLLEKHEKAGVLEWEDLTAAWHAGETIPGDKPKVLALHKSQQASYRESALKDLKLWAETVPLPDLVDNEGDYVAKCLQLAEERPAWRVGTGIVEKIVVKTLRERAIEAVGEEDKEEGEEEEGEEEEMEDGEEEDYRYDERATSEEATTEKGETKQPYQNCYKNNSTQEARRKVIEIHTSNIIFLRCSSPFQLVTLRATGQWNIIFTRRKRVIHLSCHHRSRDLSGSYGP